MHRQPEHVMTFLLAELGTSGSLDGQQRLVVKGRFAPKNFESILRKYISKLSLPPCLPSRMWIYLFQLLWQRGIYFFSDYFFIEHGVSYVAAIEE